MQGFFFSLPPFFSHTLCKFLVAVDSKKKGGLSVYESIHRADNLDSDTETMAKDVIDTFLLTPWDFCTVPQ